jgi:hypothetical protein
VVSSVRPARVVLLRLVALATILVLVLACTRQPLTVSADETRRPDSSGCPTDQTDAIPVELAGSP